MDNQAGRQTRKRIHSHRNSRHPHTSHPPNPKPLDHPNSIKHNYRRTVQTIIPSTFLSYTDNSLYRERRSKNEKTSHTPNPNSNTSSVRTHCSCTGTGHRDNPSQRPKRQRAQRPKRPPQHKHHSLRHIQRLRKPHTGLVHNRHLPRHRLRLQTDNQLQLDRYRPERQHSRKPKIHA